MTNRPLTVAFVFFFSTLARHGGVLPRPFALFTHVRSPLIMEFVKVKKKADACHYMPRPWCAMLET
jgi:hypothetical protein